MAEKDSIDGVLYTRMSDDRQETSIPQQLDWARRACQREGVEILKEFTDPAVPGDEIARRPGLQALVAFCEERFRQEAPVLALVTWDGDRFSRADSIRTAAVLCRLLDAGTTRMLTSEGWTDFEDDTDRLLHNVKQDLGRSAYVKSLAKNVTRSAIDRAREGLWNGGPPAAELDRRGAPLPRASGRPRNPDDRRWRKYTVWAMLTNPVYTGTGTYGSRRFGKYFGVSGDQVVPRRAAKTRTGKTRRLNNPPEEHVRKFDAHPALVSRALFDRVQERLAANRRAFTKGQKQHRRHIAWPLSGLLYCGHCGGRMWGVEYPGAPKGAGRVRHYVCSTHRERGKAACSHHAVREAFILPLVFGALRAALSDPRAASRLHQAVSDRLHQTRHHAGVNLESLRRREVDLAEKVRAGIQRYAVCAADLMADLAEQLRAWKEEREQVVQKIREGEAAARAEEEDSRLIGDAMRVFGRLADTVRDAGDLPETAAAAQALVEKVELHFAHRQRGRRRYSEFSHGTIHFRSAAAALGTLNLGDFDSQGREIGGRRNL
jgi:DNA invertase Pin-like site-specific DNA recombinase